MKFSPLFLLLFLHITLCAQHQETEYIFDTFKDRRIINSHSVETLQRRQLDIRIAHRFGDIAGNAGGWKTLYGLENAADILIGAEYGATDNLTLGLFRTKGAGPLKALINGQAKYRLLRQKQTGMPFTLTLLAFTAISTMEKGDVPELINYFENPAHRMVSGTQLLLARKFSNRISLQLTPGFVHRNVVPFGDENNLISIGAAARIQLTKVIGLLADFTYTVSEYRENNDFTWPLGFGLEFDTGGHVFQLNFTNATGISAADYIPYTKSNWAEGEFRMGFTISRLFNL